jgi:hypothetical protein
LIRRVPAGLALFCVLAVAALASAAAVLHFKTGTLALQVERLTCSFNPHGSGPDSVAHLRFFSRYSDPHAVVSVVGGGLSPARVLDSDVALQAGEPVDFTWDGRTDAGSIAPIGAYALRVNLPDRGRNMLWIAKRIHLGEPCPAHTRS